MLILPKPFIMKQFTDKYFIFPYKAYIKKDIKEMTKGLPSEMSLTEEPRWIQGYMSIPFQEIKSWGDDSSSEEVEFEQVLEEGHDATYLQTYTAGGFECLWGRKRFEQELNKAYNRYLENYKDAQVLIKAAPDADGQ